MAKRGRPHKEITKNSKINVHMEEKEYDKIKDYCEKHNLTLSDFMRFVAIFAIDCMNDKTK